MLNALAGSLENLYLRQNFKSRGRFLKKASPEMSSLCNGTPARCLEGKLPGPSGGSRKEEAVRAVL